MQDEQVRLRAGRDRVGTTLVVAELHEQSLVVKQFDDGADLPAGKSLRGRSVSNVTTSRTDGLSLFAPFFAFITAPNR